MALKMYSDIDIQDIADAIREKNETDETYRVDEMPAAIRKLQNVNLELTGDCSGIMSYNSGNKLIDLVGDKITTKDITNAGHMFSGSAFYEGIDPVGAAKLTNIPFDINLADDCDDYLGFMFNECVNLKSAPRINGNLSKLDGAQMFCKCWELRELPADYFETIIGGRKGVYTDFRAMFNDCLSLRKAPDFKNLRASGIADGTMGSVFSHCLVLEEILNFPLHPGFSITLFTDCQRLTRLTFQTNEDGSPLVLNQPCTVRLTYNVGYTHPIDRYDILARNSGLTEDKEVVDDATYQALKNDPDWWTEKIQYSRYNRLSAIETINSLPDCSGANEASSLILGYGGAYTDGGPVNGLTEEEIAVAAARGWTVSFASN